MSNATRIDKSPLPEITIDDLDKHDGTLDWHTVYQTHALDEDGDVTPTEVFFTKEADAKAYGGAGGKASPHPAIVVHGQTFVWNVLPRAVTVHDSLTLIHRASALAKLTIEECKALGLHPSMYDKPASAKPYAPGWSSEDDADDADDADDSESTLDIGATLTAKAPLEKTTLAYDDEDASYAELLAKYRRMIYKGVNVMCPACRGGKLHGTVACSLCNPMTHTVRVADAIRWLAARVKA